MSGICFFDSALHPEGRRIFDPSEEILSQEVNLLVFRELAVGLADEFAESLIDELESFFFVAASRSVLALDCDGRRPSCRFLEQKLSASIAHYNRACSFLSHLCGCPYCWLLL